MFLSKLSSTVRQVQVQVTRQLEEQEDLSLSEQVFHTYLRKTIWKATLESSMSSVELQIWPQKTPVWLKLYMGL